MNSETWKSRLLPECPDHGAAYLNVGVCTKCRWVDPTRVVRDTAAVSKTDPAPAIDWRSAAAKAASPASR